MALEGQPLPLFSDDRMVQTTPLLMIPGPVEVSPAVTAAAAVPPPGHTSPQILEAFGRSLGLMREVWRAGDASEPFILSGSGTLAMEVAAANLLEPGERALVVNTGYFSDRMAEILRRYGATVAVVGAPVGAAPTLDEVRETLAREGPFKALFVTHVDTSTGVRVDPEPYCRLAREAGVLSVFDGVCATAAEPFEMEVWGADVYFSASQKAIGLPPGLGLLVASERARAIRAVRQAPPPPLFLDWESWLPINRAYEDRRPSYFATPATPLILALAVGLEEIVDMGMEARWEAHAKAAAAMRAAWRALGLREVPQAGAGANTLSTLYFPEGVDIGLIPRIAARGAIVAGGLHPAIRSTTFRIGHMGYTVTRPDYLRRTVEAVAGALQDSGLAVDAGKAVAAFEAEMTAE